VKLAARYFTVLSAFAATGFAAFALVDAVPAYQENVRVAGALQQDEARMAGNRIETRLDSIERQIRAIARLPWHHDLLDDDDEREAYRRLLALNPPIFEIRSIRADGATTLFASRVALDRPASARVSNVPVPIPELRAGDVWYGRIHFQNGSRPFVTVAVAPSDPSGETTVAELDVQFASDIVERIRFGRTGVVYIIDSMNRLLAHPDPSLVHRNVDLSILPQVAAARSALSHTGTQAVTVRGTRLDSDERVLASAFEIGRSGWLVIAEQPLDEVMAPVTTSLYRTLGFLALVLLLAFAVSVLIARKLTGPILEIQRGATLVGRGDLKTRVAIATGDEIELLGSEFNRMAENLERSYAELEARVEARTQALTKVGDALRSQAREVESLNRKLTNQLRELAESKEEAERANAAKSRFLAAASHDLRQPMHTVSLLVGILRERLRGREGLDLVDKVQVSVHSMERLFNSLLDISRLDAGAIRPNVTQFPLQALLDDIAANYAPQAREKKLDLRVAPTRALVRTDAALLERIVGNLVANAIRYTHRGGVLVGTRRKPGGTSLVVCDTGVGIAEAHLDKIFDEFFQIEGAHTEQAQGLGLGLSIVRLSADLLRLPLRVTSRPGHGTVFELGLPVVAEAEALPAAASSPAEPYIEGAFVVVIDDEAENRFATEALCRQWGCHVVSGACAADAIDELGRHLRAPDLIITDYRLRDRLTGVMAIADIRRHLDAAIPAIIVTGDVAARALQDDVDIVVLRKPLDPEQLRATMSRLLALADAAR
jgi:signal transduction histidine kinase/CheY-like chemotaxis protein